MSKQENTHLATQGSHQASEGSTIADGGSLLGSICHMHVHLLAMQGLGPLTALYLPSCKGCLSKAPLQAEWTVKNESQTTELLPTQRLRDALGMCCIDSCCPG